jgi:hypothetical protein
MSWHAILSTLAAARWSQSSLPGFFFYDLLDNSSTDADLLFADLNDSLRLEGIVSGTALGIKELQQLLQGLRICGVTQERALPAYKHQAFVLELVEVVGKRRVGNVQFFLDLAYHQAFRMRRQQQLHNTESRFSSHG